MEVDNLASWKWKYKHINVRLVKATLATSDASIHITMLYELNCKNEEDKNLALHDCLYPCTAMYHSIVSHTISSQRAIPQKVQY